MTCYILFPYQRDLIISCATSYIIMINHIVCRFLQNDVNTLFFQNLIYVLRNPKLHLQLIAFLLSTVSRSLVLRCDPEKFHTVTLTRFHTDTLNIYHKSTFLERCLNIRTARFYGHICAFSV